VTNYTDYDVKFPSLGNNAIVFERSGYLWVMDLATEAISQVHVQINSDELYSRSDLLMHLNLLKVGIRARWKQDGVCARGDVFTVPADKVLRRHFAHKRSA